MQSFMYLKIYEDILQNINSQKINKKLPSEHEFAKIYNVNRHTIRKALLKLKDIGKIKTLAGKGNFVNNKAFAEEKVAFFSDNILGLELGSQNTLLSAKTIRAPKEVALNLGAPKDIDAIEIKTKNEIDGVTVSLSNIYLDAQLYNSVLEHIDMKPFCLSTLLSLSKINIKKSSSKFIAQLPNKELQKELGISKDTPLLSANITIKDQFNTTVAYITKFFRSDICSVEVDLN